MKTLTNGIVAICCLSIVGCNQLTRLGSQGLVFDSDPFTEIDSNQRVAAAQQPPTGRVAVGNLNGQGQSAPPTYANMQNQMMQQQQAMGQPPQAQPAVASQAQYAQYNYSPAQQPLQQQPMQPQQITQVGYQPHPQGNGMMIPPADNPVSSAASRAAAETAAMLAKRPAAPTSANAVNPASYSPPPGTATYGAAPFDTQAGTTQPVPMPPEAQFDPASQQWELTEADLELPSVPQQQSDPRMFPGTSIPMPTGRAALADALPPEWEPAPMSPTNPPATGTIPTHPVFSPPATQSGTAPAVVTTPAASPIIQDSTNVSKWRAVRRQ